MPIALDFIKYYEDKGFLINKLELQETLEFIISQHATMGHTSEVCYSIFGMILFNLSFSQLTIQTLETIENPFVALLTLDAQQQGLITKLHTFVLWESLMVAEELNTSNWPLAYEALMKGWLPPVKGVNYIDNDDGFKYLKAKNVQFYDHAAIDSYTPAIKYWALKDITPEQLKYVLEPASKVLQQTSYVGG